MSNETQHNHDNTTNATFEVEHLEKFVQVPKWIVRHPKLSVGAKALYAALMAYADNTKLTAFPGQKLLAKDLAVSTRSISAYTKELETQNILVVTRRRNKKTGNFYANHYRLRWSAPDAKNDIRRDAKNDTITKPTILTTPTSPNATDANIGASNLTPSLSSEVHKNHSMKEQLGITEPQASHLLKLARDSYTSPDFSIGYMEEIETLLNEWALVDAGDAIFNKRWDDRLFELVARHGLDYGSAKWLAQLVAWSRVN